VLVIPCTPLLIWSDYLVLKSFLPLPDDNDDDDDEEEEEEEEEEEDEDEDEDDDSDDDEFIVEFTYIVVLYSN
jgi:hypothetical protein